MGRNGTADVADLDWDSQDTAARVAVLKHRQDRADDDREEMKDHISYVKTQFLPDGVVGKVASDVKSIKLLGWLVLVGVPSSVTVIGALIAGLLWLIHHAAPSH